MADEIRIVFPTNAKQPDLVLPLPTVRVEGSRPWGDGGEQTQLIYAGDWSMERYLDAGGASRDQDGSDADPAYVLGAIGAWVAWYLWLQQQQQQRAPAHD